MQLLGTTLAGRYRLNRVLGEGGMASVFEGTDLLLNRPVAVKLLHWGLAGDPAVLARFWREAQAAAAISHPNVVAAYDFGEHDGASFIVLELAEGKPLNELVAREGPLPPERAVAIIAGVCDALHAAHARGLVHRDIKPGNVMVGPGDAVKVMDFGLAQPAEVACGLTDPGTVVGTAYYLSPEQAVGGEADARSDIYAVGICLYELLSGVRPFSGSTPPDVAIQHVSATPRSLDELRPGLSPALVAAVEQAMAKRPEDRPPSALALRKRLERALRSPVLAPVGGRGDADGEATARLSLIAGASPPVAAAAEGTAPHAVVPRVAAGRAERLARSRAAERRLRRWLAVLALALFVIAVGSATMLSLRAEPIAGAAGGAGADGRLTATPPSKGGVTSTTKPERSGVAPAQGRGGVRAGKPAQRREARAKGDDKGKARGKGAGDQGGGEGDGKA